MTDLLVCAGLAGLALAIGGPWAALLCGGLYVVWSLSQEVR